MLTRRGRFVVVVASLFVEFVRSAFCVLSKTAFSVSLFVTLFRPGSPTGAAWGRFCNHLKDFYWVQIVSLGVSCDVFLKTIKISFMRTPTLEWLWGQPWGPPQESLQKAVANGGHDGNRNFWAGTSRAIPELLLCTFRLLLVRVRRRLRGPARRGLHLPCGAHRGDLLPPLSAEPRYLQLRGTAQLSSKYPSIA